ncbi:MAG: nickel-type superoxide dismutase maturation protease [Acidimicrobiales bacterium]
MTATRRWLAVALVAGGVSTARGLSRLSRVEVVGDSMRPALEPGDRLVLSRSRCPRPGELVAVADPRQPRRTVLKRLVEVSPAGLTVLGDNASASTDSRTFGPVGADAVRGRVIYRYHPAHRRGRLLRSRSDQPLVT